MTAREDLRKAAQRPDDVIAEVLRDHAEIKELFTETETATGEQKHEAFTRLMRKLVVHETAEQEVVHPLGRLAEQDGAVVEERLQEEKTATEVLSELEQMGVDDPRFDQKLVEFERDVLQHAEREEKVEHPHIDKSAEAGQLEKLLPVFRAAEASAPTHPHPHSPTSAAGNVLLGPPVAIMDRARDALREAKKRMKS